MYNYINKGDKVCWSVGEQKVQGEVVDMYKHQIVSTQFALNNQQATEVRKALLIALEDGRKVLKLENEVSRAI
jgi:hypothetical protein